MNMTFEEVKQKLEAQKNISITKIDDIGHGKSIRLSNGSIINCYSTGKVVVQGKNQDVTSQILNNQIGKNKKIFVVYGHDEIAKTQLEALLRRWDLQPIILDQEASCGQTIIEKLEAYISEVSYAIVLATPDDEGKAIKEAQSKKRVRQNVVLELGMFLAKLGREKVAILLKEDPDFEKPSDIQGLIYIPFQTKVDDAAISLVKELAKQGYHIDNKNL
ncbi:TIR domain-containing protein [Candidatus Avelusimicrobium facis]|uniref:TIR domain-containing protein n=1 Tax=Candidatus Avelusimicrobium facis TaxID=3416203 RepID=UPI003D134929